MSMASNMPPGKAGRPERMYPQQLTVPSILIPQVKLLWAVMALNAPGGASVRPESLSPQQLTVSSVLMAHV